MTLVSMQRKTRDDLELTIEMLFSTQGRFVITVTSNGESFDGADLPDRANDIIADDLPQFTLYSGNNLNNYQSVGEVEGHQYRVDYTLDFIFMKAIRQELTEWPPSSTEIVQVDLPDPVTEEGSDA